MFRGPGSIIISKERHQRDKEKSKDKSNQNIFEYSFLRGDPEDCHILPPSACLDYLLRLQLDLVQPRRFAVVIFAAKIKRGQAFPWEHEAHECLLGRSRQMDRSVHIPAKDPAHIVGEEWPTSLSASASLPGN